MSAAPSPETTPGTSFTGGPFALFTHLARTSLFLEALQDECLSPFGISFGDYAVLRLLQESNESMPPSRLAELVLRTTGGMTKIVDRLERLGHVRRTPDPDDGRGVLVSLTPKGRRTCDKSSAAYTAGRTRVLAHLGTDDVVTIDRALARLLDAFEQDRDAQRKDRGDA
jgi:DNA-binding MarR family transcriptional regulator